MASMSDLRNGLTIRINGEIFTVTEYQHVKPGKGGAFARTKIKRLIDGSVRDRTFRPNEKIETVRIEEREMQYMYQNSDFLYFMDNETFEEIQLTSKLIGSSIEFLKEGENIKVKMDGEIPIAIELPTFVTLKIIETDPGLRGDTVSGGTKPAKLETGGSVNVPLFVENNTLIKVDTRTGSYVERA